MTNTYQTVRHICRHTPVLATSQSVINPCVGVRYMASTNFGEDLSSVNKGKHAHLGPQTPKHTSMPRGDNITYQFIHCTTSGHMQQILYHYQLC